MILCGYTADVGVGGVRSGGGRPPQKYIIHQEGRVGRYNNKHATTSNRAYVLEGSISEDGTPPPHNSDTLLSLMAGNKHTHISQLDYHQVSLIKKTKQDVISMQPYNCYIPMFFLDILN